MAKTFLQLQNEVLQWMADENDTGLMRNLVKQTLDKCQRKILTSEQLDFMLSPLMTLNVVSGTKIYPLPENFFSLLYVKDPDTGDYLEEIPGKSVVEAQEGLVDVTDLTRFMITTVENVRVQPSTPAVVTITLGAGTESASNGVIVQGLDSTGAWIEEALSSGSAWSTLTSGYTFAHITNVIKTGTTWTRTMIASCGATTVLILLATEWTKQYQQLEFMRTPTTNEVLNYRYFTKPVDLVYDYQPPQLPDAFRDILVYDALLLLPGFTRSTGEELQSFERQRMELYTQLKQNHQQSRSLGARARRVRMVDRV